MQGTTVLRLLLVKGNATKSLGIKYHVSGSCHGNLLSRKKGKRNTLLIYKLRLPQGSLKNIDGPAKKYLKI